MKEHNSIKFSRCVPLPIGYKLAVCQICGGIHLMGTLLNENAEEQDPGIMCKDCDNIISEATKDPNFELEDETRSISINNREFEFFDVYCPDLKEPNSFLWDESAKIY